MRTAILLAAAVLAAPAFAQSIAPAPANVRAAAAVPYQETAACVAENNPKDARKVFAEPPGSAREMRLIDRLYLDYGCREITNYPDINRQEKTVAHLNRRGFLAEAMLKRDMPGFATAAAPAVARPTSPVAVTPAAANSRERQAQTVEALGQCLVASDWTNIRAMLAAPYASPAESAAMSALQPAMGSCVAADFAMRIHPLYLRAAIAEAAYEALRPAGA